jgi:2-polyprenyl-3-methyl-5-hydroxy-6-metoxy-1,4-benzoquinol methylase
MIRPAKKTNSEIAREWDVAAPVRYRQIISGVDKTYNSFMIPLYVDETAQRNYEYVLDAGCGVGLLSRAVAGNVGAIQAIDLSRGSVEIAIQKCALPNVTYSVGDVSLLSKRGFNLVIANMFFMDCLNLRDVVKALATSCADGAVLLATITNPFVWPRYWKYEGRKWFDYRKEIVIEADFRIMNETLPLKTTHVHLRSACMLIFCGVADLESKQSAN